MVSRRTFGKLAGSVAIASHFRGVAERSAPDYKIEISDVNWELSPKRVVHTTAYNGQVPGPLLRLREGRPVTIEITNRSPHPEVVHWHGLYLPSRLDGASEEGTPFIAPGATTQINFTPQPAGFRWYHTHTMAMNDLKRAQYGGQHGPLIVEPRINLARYDQEIFLNLHDWYGRLLTSDDSNMSPIYEVTSINGRMMGYGEPIRVKRDQTVLMHILNSSPTEVHWISLSGHSFTIVALDGNPIPSPTSVPMLRLAPAERVSAIVQMNNPGVWVLGEVRRHVQATGMAIVLEYADRTGSPKWEQPDHLQWNYAAFAEPTELTSADKDSVNIPLVLDSKFRGHGSMEAWTINGEMYPNSSVQPLKRGQRYRLQFMNRSADDHPMHLHRHSFELKSVDVPLKQGKDKPPAALLRGVRKDVVLVKAGTQTDVEFVADNPGDTLLHCHQQNHMDVGFMMLLHYA